MQLAARERAVGPRDRQREETRERLFRAALEEMRRTGAGAAQVDRIVAAARVSRGSFYFHFPTKEDVLREWERRREAELTAQLTRPRAGASLSLRDALLEVVRFLTALATSADGRLLLDVLSVHVREGSDPGTYPLLAEIQRRLEAALASGEMRRDIDARQATILFSSNVFGFLVTRTTSRPPHPQPELLVDVFLNGVEARGTSTASKSRSQTRTARKRGTAKTAARRRPR